MKRIWKRVEPLFLAWGAFIVLAGLWDLGREIANHRKTNH